MGEEHPPLGKTFIQSLDQNDYNYPIVSILKDPRLAGYKLPTDLSPHPDTLRYPNYYLTTVTFPSPSDQRVYWMYNRIAGAVMTVKDKNDDGTVLTITKQLQFAADIVCGESVTGATVGSKVWTRVTQEHQSFGVATKITESRVIDGTKVYKYDNDAETFQPVTIISEVVVVADYNLDITYTGTEFFLNPIVGSSLIATKISSAIKRTGPDDFSLLNRIEYSIAPYNILSCIFGWTTGSFVALDGSVGINFNFTKSGSFSTPCLHEITVEYFAVQPEATPADALIPIDIVYDGIFAKVNQQNVMCDELDVYAFNTDDDNPKWGLASENFGPYGPSNPTATEYVALLDAGLSISSTVKPWKYNLWRRESVKVFFPTPVPPAP